MEHSSDIQDKARAVASLHRYYAFVFIGAVAMGLAQWICLLAVLNPQAWMSAAHVARWVYAVALLIPTLFLLAGLLLGKMVQIVQAKVPVTQAKSPWLLLSLLCNVVTITALWDERYNLSLTLGFGWGALSTIKKWVFPSEKERIERHRRADGIFQLLAFALLAATLELRSVSLSFLLVVEQMASLAVLFLRTIKDTRRVAAEQKDG